MERASKHRRRLLVNFSGHVREINRSIINEIADPLTLDKLTPVVTTVANARADYLRALFNHANESADDNAQSDVSELKRARERYEELVSAANAMEIMIERGYLDVADSRPSALAS